MLPIRSIFRAISSDALIMDSRPDWFSWKCFFCEDYAQDGVHLEMQFFGFENSLYHDSNGTLWVCCGNCLKYCHLHCINANLTEAAFEQNLFVHVCQK